MQRLSAFQPVKAHGILRRILGKAALPVNGTGHVSQLIGGVSRRVFHTRTLLLIMPDFLCML